MYKRVVENHQESLRLEKMTISDGVGDSTLATLTKKYEALQGTYNRLIQEQVTTKKGYQELKKQFEGCPAVRELQDLLADVRAKYSASEENLKKTNVELAAKFNEKTALEEQLHKARERNKTLMNESEN